MERQLGTTLEEIRHDHRARYSFATTIIPPYSSVIDAACGIGYGTKIINDALQANPGSVCMATGIDIDEEAIWTARQFYSGPQYHCKDLTKPLQAEVDVIVSFETIEHMADPAALLLNFAGALKWNGLLIISTPNEERYPFKAENFKHDVYPHLRHFTPAEFETLLKANGFMPESKHCQVNKFADVTDGTDGMFLVYVCRRR